MKFGNHCAELQRLNENFSGERFYQRGVFSGGGGPRTPAIDLA
jgi:hypothetical protein